MIKNRWVSGVHGVSRIDRLVLVVIVLVASVFPVDLQPGTQRESRGAYGQYSGRQGQVLLVSVSVDSPSARVSGNFLGRHVPFYRNPEPLSPNDYLGLVGIDILAPPGTHELRVEVQSPAEDRWFSYHILVVDQSFPVQHLTLPKDKVELDPKTLVRVKAEQKRVRSVLGLITDERQWRESFIEPVKGVVAGAFGRKRVINGHPRSPHSGEDIAAPLGTPVVSTNTGTVRLTVDHFFSGKGVFVDHGLGLHSMYFHLSEILVKEGQSVQRGQAIGKVGATGRATGPHLHWGIRLNGARVDPYSLTRVSVNGQDSSHLFDSNWPGPA